MPRLHAYLHFRIIDVSTLNELGKRWTPGKLQLLPKKASQHTAMADLLESLEELRVYQNHMFGLSPKGHPIFLKYQPEFAHAHAVEVEDVQLTQSLESTASAAVPGGGRRVGRQIRRQ